jgi:hypothetical protein
VTALRGAVVAVATALGALFAVGCVLAALFEAQGFGRPRDTDPRTGYLLLLAVALVACVGVPYALWRRLLPERAPSFVLAFAAAVVGVIAILGIGFS